MGIGGCEYSFWEERERWVERMDGREGGVLMMG